MSINAIPPSSPICHLPIIYPVGHTTDSEPPSAAAHLGLQLVCAPVLTTMVALAKPKLPAYDNPDEKWEAIAASLDEELPTDASEPLAAVEWGGVGDEDALGAVASALHRDGACMIRNALPTETALAIHSQMEPHLAARAEAGLLNKQSAGVSGRQAGSVLSRSRASWDAAMHPLVMELCSGVLGRQVPATPHRQPHSPHHHHHPPTH